MLSSREQRLVALGREPVQLGPLVAQLGDELLAGSPDCIQLLLDIARLHDQLLDPLRRVRLLDAQVIDLALETSLLRTRIDELAPELLTGIRAGSTLEWRGRCTGVRFIGGVRSRRARSRVAAGTDSEPVGRHVCNATVKSGATVSSALTRSDPASAHGNDACHGPPSSAAHGLSARSASNRLARPSTVTVNVGRRKRLPRIPSQRPRTSQRSPSITSNCSSSKRT